MRTTNPRPVMARAITWRWAGSFQRRLVRRFGQEPHSISTLGSARSASTGEIRVPLRRGQHRSRRSRSSTSWCAMRSRRHGSAGPPRLARTPDTSGGSRARSAHRARSQPVLPLRQRLGLRVRRLPSQGGRPRRRAPPDPPAGRRASDRNRSRPGRGRSRRRFSRATYWSRRGSVRRDSGRALPARLQDQRAGQGNVLLQRARDPGGAWIGAAMAGSEDNQRRPSSGHHRSAGSGEARVQIRETVQKTAPAPANRRKIRRRRIRIRCSYPELITLTRWRLLRHPRNCFILAQPVDVYGRAGRRRAMA